MLLEKPLSELEYTTDIAPFIELQEPESAALDYKLTLAGTDRGKAELAKDASAFANSQGGYLLIGIEEKSGRPDGVPGIESTLNNVRVEDWVEQVLNSNISPKIQHQIRWIPIPSSDKGVLVVRIPISPQAPHMVTTQGDNRFYRRYFKRHEFQALPAEENEVRELFYRSLRVYDESLHFLETMGYADKESAVFGHNRLTNRLSTEGGFHLATFSALPLYIQGDLIDVTSKKMWDWLDPNKRRYEPTSSYGIVPINQKYSVHDGIVCTDEIRRVRESNDPHEQFLLIDKRGYVEAGLTRPGVFEYNNEVVYRFIPMLRLFSQFCFLVSDLYRTFGIVQPFRLMLNLVGTENTLLGSLGLGWLEPVGDYQPYQPRCIDQNIQITKDFSSVEALDSDLDSDIEGVIREFATRIDAAWGQQVPRCYNNSQNDPEQKIDWQQHQF